MKGKKIVSVRKMENGVKYPSSAYLHVGDIDDVNTWRYRIKDKEGNINIDLLNNVCRETFFIDICEGVDVKEIRESLKIAYESMGIFYKDKQEER